MTVRILTGDCRDLLPTLDAESFDSCVTDPPYELGFMGKKWDSSGVSFQPATWANVLRLLKPGSYLLAFGGTRTFHRMTCAIEDAGFEIHDCLSWLYGSGFPKHKSKLKPAWEPIVVARKPAPKATPLQIDACRIPFADAADAAESKAKNRHADFGSGEIVGYHGWDSRAAGGNYDPEARWPANVAVDEEAGFLIGDAARFFYCAKASRAERERGLGDDARRALNWSSGSQSPGTFQSPGTDKTSSNPHPTVKPLALMRWLCRLVTPAGGLVLDPFLGSGTTGVATEAEGFSLVGCELDRANVSIANRRIKGDSPLFAEVTT